MKFFDLGKLCTQLLQGANIVSVVLMCIFGYSYLVDPTVMRLTAPMGLVYPFFMVINLLFMFFWLMVKKSGALTSFVGFLICFYPTRLYIGINPPSSANTEECMKVMSMNVLGFQGQPETPLSHDNNPLIQYLIDADCDILCLQESFENNISEEQLTEFRKVYPYHREDHNGDKSVRLGLFTKYPILDAEIIEYESVANLSMAYRILLDKDTVLVINNHLETNKFSQDEKEQFRSMMKGKMNKHEAREESLSVLGKLMHASMKRAPQARAVAKYVEEHSGMPIILCGDFNENPISFTHHVIAKNLTDCFVSVGHGLGWTYCRNGMRVRIDNIMCSEHFTPATCSVDNSISYSDHYPITCTLKNSAPKGENEDISLKNE